MEPSLLSALRGPRQGDSYLNPAIAVVTNVDLHFFVISKPVIPEQADRFDIELLDKVRRKIGGSRIQQTVGVKALDFLPQLVLGGLNDLRKIMVAEEKTLAFVDAAEQAGSLKIWSGPGICAGGGPFVNGHRCPSMLPSHKAGGYRFAAAERDVG
jgi:hypothetical protein